MDIFETMLQQSTSNSDGLIDFFEKIAVYYEGRHMVEAAARHYGNCRKYETAINLYLKGGTDENLQSAIDVIGKARDGKLTQKLAEYLQGKDPQYMYSLWKAVGNFEQAGKTALLIAKNEQDRGNYRTVHDLLFKTFKDLKEQHLPIPLDLYKKMVLLHSYVIVKRIVKRGEHYTAAQLLLRVANDIHQFPEHTVPILTSVVVECQRAQLKKEAFANATLLMKPEYRTSIADPYKRKIEAIVRKKQDPGTENVTPAPTAPCPYCASSIPRHSVDCNNCLNILPLCVYTGMFVTKDDFSSCPKCKFPALYSEIKAAEDACPLCNENFLIADAHQIADPETYLQTFSMQFRKIE